MKSHKSTTELDVYSEGRKKIYVGHLAWLEDKNKYRFEYSRDYLKNSGAIPMGPELPMTSFIHLSKTSELFPSLEDRIPSKANPAYVDYCRQCKISPEETNRIILLTTIGKRGPSTFVFEPIYITGETQTATELINFRKETGISLRVMAKIFDFNFITLQRIEKNKSNDKSTLRLLYIYLNCPEVALWLITINAAKVPPAIIPKLRKYFTNKVQT